MTSHTTLHREQGRYALIAGYIVIWLLMTLLSVASLGYMSAIQEQLRDIVAVHNTKKDLVKQMHASTRERVFSLQHMLLLDDPFERDTESMKIDTYGVKFTNARDQFMKLPLDPAEQQLMISHAVLASRAGPAQRDAISLIMENEMERARQLLLDEVIPIQQQALAVLRDLEEYQDTSIKQALQHGEDSYRNAGLLLIILGGVAVLLLLSIAVKVFKVMRHAAQALHEEKDRLRVTLNSIGDGVIATDSHGLIEYINPVAEQYTGWSQEEAKGTNIFDVFHVINAADDTPVATSLDALIDESRITDPHHHCLLQRRDGLTLAVDFTSSAIHHEDGSVGGYVTVFRDESELREMAHHLSHQAAHDPLTNLINRREFERHLIALLRRGELNNGEHVLCYLDLDRFKVVNDSCGHAAGDELLKQLVTLFKHRVRNNDLLARIGGDEFGLLLENCPVERALRITEEIRHTVHRYRFVWKGQSFQVGVSIGMVAIDNRWQNLPELLAAADAACYAAKDGGRNRVHLYLNSDSGEPGEEATWPARIRDALEHDGLIHYYQKPVALSATPAEPHCYDLQLRIKEQGWQHLPLAPLMPQAERHGLAPRIDRWAVENALVLARLREDYQAIHAVQLSASSLQDTTFVSDIATIARQRSISPAQLCLEIPEGYLLTATSQAYAAALGLKEQGFRIALNGTGESIGAHDTLRNLPFDYVRIAGDFVYEALEDPIHRIRLEAIVRMAHSMGMQVIVMDVQSGPLLELLAEIGADYLSGTGIDKPQPAIALLITDPSRELSGSGNHA